MKLIRLYSNQSEIFAPIVFNDGISAVVAEIRVPANRQLDTHNLGKTTIGELIDFLLLRRKSSTFFLFKREDLFGEFTFYLELQLDDTSFLTVARPVNPGSRAWFLKSESSTQDASSTPVESWSHSNVPFDRARLLLDGYFSIDVLRPYDYRKLVGYLFRSQADYLDVFQLGKFSGKHHDWKPFVAQLLGMSSGSVAALYAKREELNQAATHLSALRTELGGATMDLSVIDGLISVRRRDAQAKSAVLESFDFNTEDRIITGHIVEEIESSIAGLNEQSYQLSQLIRRIEQSLEGERILFSTEASETLFAEAGVLFPDALTKSYTQLVRFNRAITEERRDSLQVQLEGARADLTAVNASLVTLNAQRAASLGFLRESESLAKFRDLSKELTRVQADLNSLEARREAAARIQELRQQHRTLQEEFGHLETVVEEERDEVSRDETSRFGRLRGFFSQIVLDVLGQNAILAIKLNSSGGIDFTAEFVGNQGTATSGDKGTSYKKLLCIAFDLAMLRAYSDTQFPRFVYHDGALEQLEPRKRENLIRVLREYADFGLQPIISVLDSDLPDAVNGDGDTLHSSDVIALLHDEGEDGRLFRMPTW
ncbi:DUF2326 domain-containing protein [Rathayibacter sp. AY1E2]|uniref:DUF2326 domain-containing protein n=1 Tax=Rathayibacter sp. AY1E2 TaxID=2080550 RepID=UPI000CE8CBB0|nr:DUF2326 domain-containing protein [Rathayibacter sp. AY1E2]PPH53152.1 DUF2326 domain-containing protein [Rathayibacter sp. AY1E2]